MSGPSSSAPSWPPLRMGCGGKTRDKPTRQGRKDRNTGVEEPTISDAIRCSNLSVHSVDPVQWSPSSHRVLLREAARTADIHLSHLRQLDLQTTWPRPDLITNGSLIIACDYCIYTYLTHLYRRKKDKKVNNFCAADRRPSTVSAIASRPALNCFRHGSPLPNTWVSRHTSCPKSLSSLSSLLFSLFSLSPFIAQVPVRSHVWICEGRVRAQLFPFPSPFVSLAEWRRRPLPGSWMSCPSSSSSLRLWPRLNQSSHQMPHYRPQRVARRPSWA